MSLAPISISVDLTGALSSNNIRVNIPSQFTISIASKDPGLMQNAVRYLLDQDEHGIQTTAKEIIIGSLREVVASLSIEELTRSRETFIKAINTNVRSELNKIGLDLVNSNLRDISDESGYIVAMGQRAAAEAINKANIDVSEQKRLGTVGVETNTRSEKVSVAEQQAQTAIGIKTAERDQQMQTAALDAETIKAQNEAQANIADSRAELAKRSATAHQEGEVATAKANTVVANEQRLATQAELEKDQLPKAEVAKAQLVIEANAQADQARAIAQGEADAILMKYEAEAKGLELLLSAKAAGYKLLVESANGDTAAAATLLMIEKMAEIVKINSEALANLKSIKSLSGTRARVRVTMACKASSEASQLRFHRCRRSQHRRASSCRRSWAPLTRKI